MFIRVDVEHFADFMGEEERRDDRRMILIVGLSENT